MKFAIVDGKRREAEPQLAGECAACGSPMVPKCGEVRIHHWAHRGRRRCDPWWENETEWHRAWKGQFSSAWQEYVHRADDGERHIADVRTDHNWVLEFQHSHISPVERRAREAFYPKLMWVVDGTRRKRDASQFQRALDDSRSVGRSPMRRVSSGDGALLRDWAASPAHTFFDFGDGGTLWWLSPASDENWAYVMPVAVSDFVSIHLRTDADGAGVFHEMALKFARSITARRDLPNLSHGNRGQSLLKGRRPPRRGRRL